MSLSRITPPIDYLSSASRASLESFELSRLNHAANLRRDITALIDQWIEETADAMLARWMLDHHQLLHPASAPTPDLLHLLEMTGVAPLPSFPDGALDVGLAPPRYALAGEDFADHNAAKKRA